MITPREMANLLSRAVEVADDSGTATGGSTTTLVDTRKHWLADWSGAVAHIFRNGIEYEVNITSNTTTELTLAQTLPFAVEAGVTYSLRRRRTLADISDRSPRLLGIIDSLTKWGGTALTGRDISTDLAKLDLALTALRDAITAAAPDNKTLNDLYTKLHTLLYSNLEPVIDDPGFETGGANYWEFSYTTGGSYSVQSTEKYEGSYALQVSPAANGYLRGIAYGDYIPLTSRQRVKVAAALKADANISYSYLIAEFYDVNLAVLDRRLSVDLGNNYDWKEVEVPIVSDPPAGACFYRIGFDFRSGGTAGTAYCDKFSVPHPLKGAGRRTLTDLYGYLATEATLTAQLNITLSALRDAICAAGVNAKTLNDLYGYLARYGQLPSDLTAAGNLKLSIQESAITVPFDLQAQLRALHASTTTALAANASWTSTSEEVLNFGRITGTVFADVAGTIYVEQSPDNTNWDVVDSWSVAANAGLGFSVELVGRYVRIRYVNGATLQGTFRCVAWKRVQS